MAANLADLFEHAADAFAGRTAVVCGDRQVTYAGLDARNSIEATEALIAVGKLRAAVVIEDGSGTALAAGAGLAGAGHASAGYGHRGGPTVTPGADAIGPTAAGKADYGRAHQHAATYPPAELAET